MTVEGKPPADVAIDAFLVRALLHEQHPDRPLWCTVLGMGSAVHPNQIHRQILLVGVPQGKLPIDQFRLIEGSMPIPGTASSP